MLVWSRKGKTLISDNMMFSAVLQKFKNKRDGKTIYLAAALVLECFWSPAILSI